MDFELNAEQREIGTTVRSWAEKQLGTSPGSWARTAADAKKARSELLTAASDLGWLSVTVPEEHDTGLGLGLLEATCVVEALGRSLAPPSVEHALGVIEALRLAGNAEQQSIWLPRIATGQSRAALALRRVGGAWDTSGIGIHVDDASQLTGEAMLIGDPCPDVVVIAATDRMNRVELHLVELPQTGAGIEDHDAVDPTACSASLTLDGVRGDPMPISEDAYQDLIDRLTVLTCADLLGTARGALALTVDSLSTRHQFGVPVGRFQAIQHELAEVYVGVALVEHGCRYLAHAHDAGYSDVRLMTSAVKAKASEVAIQLAEAVVQFHGAIGFTWEHDAHLFFKRLHRDAFHLGDHEFHLGVVADTIINENSAQSSTATLGGIAS